MKLKFDQDLAFQIKIDDIELQKYAQTYPFVNGVDSSLNRKLRSATRENLKTRLSRNVSFEHRIVNGELSDFLSYEDQEKIMGVAKKLRLTGEQVQQLMSQFAWKVAHIPREAERILCFGCAAGNELIAVRALFPKAKLYAVDYSLNIRQSWINYLNMTDYVSMRFDDFFIKNTTKFDAVFSNHVLEHLYDPDKTLELVKNSCISGGKIVSALPLEGTSYNPHYRKLLDITANNRELTALEFSWLNLGHPWKTNIQDLTTTFENAGYHNIVVVSRSFYPSGFPQLNPLDHSSWLKLLKIGNQMNITFLEPVRSITEKIFLGEVPEIFVKLYLALDSRLWFGTISLLRSSPEVLITAQI